MTTDVADTSTHTRQHFLDPSGAEVSSREESLLSPEAAVVTAVLQLHNGVVTFEMEVEYNPNTYPHMITGGTITSGICGAPWEITGGYLGDTMRLDATRQGGGSCATTITVVGEFQNPPAYRGTYGFDGATSWFRHTTRYLT
jgi:hypothetical protein